MNRIFLWMLTGLFLVMGCKQNNPDKVPEGAISQVPQWSKKAIWYQIFVERFANGDTTNDPTRDDIKYAYPDEIPESWKVTPWGQQWYKPDTYFHEVESPKFQDRLQLRRYGGDLLGVLNKIDYLKNLGITAVYFNPLNDSPSLHKYDPRHWRHIDRNFGPHPEKDIQKIAEENPLDPSTWVFTSADSLFLEVVRQLHQHGIKVILDYSWNHTGMDFWALNDIKEKGEQSAFVDWYDIEQFDNPETPKNELEYKGWYGIKYLPELRKAIVGQDSIFPFEGNLASEQVKQHIFNVARRWLDPNGDGNTEDGIDGFRLDVAAEIPLGFWPEFRQQVRKINPDAYLVGEVWWQEWPDKLMDPAQFLEGDIFDAIMNYRWYRQARYFFSGGPELISPSAFVDSLMKLNQGIDKEHQMAMMNVKSSHDAPRLSTSLYNKNKYKSGAKTYDNLDYKIDKPDAETRDIQKMLLVHEYTYIGAPHIWYGDEVGMWGADDPDTRKPMVWPEIDYENETLHPEGKTRALDVVKQDTALLNYYKKLIALRKSHDVLVYGKIDFVIIDDANEVLAYKRWNNDEEIFVVFNQGNESKKIVIDNATHEKYIMQFSSRELMSKKGKIELVLVPMTAEVLISDD